MPPSLIETLVQQARVDPQRIVCPRLVEERVLRAARALVDRGTRPPRPARRTRRRHSPGRPDSASIWTGSRSRPGRPRPARNGHLRVPRQIRPAVGESARRKAQVPAQLACALVMVDRADALAAGITYSTGEVVLAAQAIIGLQRGSRPSPVSASWKSPDSRDPRATCWRSPTARSTPTPGPGSWPTSQPPPPRPSPTCSAGSPGWRCCRSPPRAAATTRLGPQGRSRPSRSPTSASRNCSLTASSSSTPPSTRGRRCPQGTAPAARSPGGPMSWSSPISTPATSG